MKNNNSIKNYSFFRLQSLKDTLEKLPQEITTTIEVDGKKYEYIEDYIEEVTRDFFNVSRSDYENLKGKYFINDDEDVVIRVLDIPVDKDDYEFLYEIFYKHGKRNWENDDYIWLQNAGEEYKKYCLTPYTEMNIAAEEMYHLGKDGRLYQDPDCSRTYDVVFNEITDQEDINYLRKQIEKSLKRE
jgi:hypothetical protein